MMSKFSLLRILPRQAVVILPVVLSLLIGVFVFGATQQKQLNSRAATPTTLSGTLVAYHEDDFLARKSNITYFLRTTTGSYKLTGLQPKYAIGSKVTINGGLQGKTLSVTSVSGSTQTENTFSKPSMSKQGQSTLLVIPMNINHPNYDKRPYTRDQIADVIFRNPKSVVNFFKEASFGLKTLVPARGAANPIDSVYDWVTIDDDPAWYKENGTLECYEDAWVVSANNKLGINPDSYGEIIYILPAYANCPIGISYVNGNIAIMSGNLQAGSISHEIGHSLGIDHANTLDCGAKQTGYYDKTSGNTCTVREYYDTSDTMSFTSEYPHHFNDAFKTHLGWKAPSQIKTTGTYNIYPLEKSGNSTQIYKPDTNQYYFLTYRYPFAETFDFNSQAGVFIHIFVNQNNGLYPTYLIDTTPGDGNTSNGSLTDGKTFCDPINHISIKQLSHDATKASVSVNLNDTSCIDTAPSPSPTPVSYPTIEPPDPPYTIIQGYVISKDPAPKNYWQSSNKCPGGYSVGTGLTIKDVSSHSYKIENCQTKDPPYYSSVTLHEGSNKVTLGGLPTGYECEKWIHYVNTDIQSYIIKEGTGCTADDTFSALSGSMENIHHVDFHIKKTSAPVPSSNPTCTQAQNSSLRGNVDSINGSGVVEGWALDTDVPSKSIQVELFADGCVGIGTSLGRVTTTVLRADVNSAYNVSGNHGFKFNIPDAFRDGSPHPLYAHAIDGNGNGVNILIPPYNPPNTFTLSSGTGGAGLLSPTPMQWQVSGHVWQMNSAGALVGKGGVTVQLWENVGGVFRPHDVVTDSYGNWKTDYTAKGEMYSVRIKNSPKAANGKPLYMTSWLLHTKDQQRDGKINQGNTPLGSASYENQKAGSDDCAGEDTLRSGKRRCDFIYTNGNDALLYPSAPTNLRYSCDLTDPTKPKATISWNSEGRATNGYLVRADAINDSWNENACTASKTYPFDFCVNNTTKTSWSIGPLKPGQQYHAWIASQNKEGAITLANKQGHSYFSCGVAPTPVTCNSATGDLTCVTRYKGTAAASGPCYGKAVGQCRFETRTFFNTSESVTAYGRYWNWSGDTLTSSGDLTSVARFSQGPCLGKTVGQCHFDTRAQFTLNGKRYESVTAYGKHFTWEIISSTSVGPLVQGLLHTTTGGAAWLAAGPCVGKNPCVINTRMQNGSTEVASAYGLYWQWTINGTNRTTTNNRGTVLSAHPRFGLAGGPCYQKSSCVIDTHTQAYVNGKWVESVTAYGSYWNW